MKEIQCKTLPPPTSSQLGYEPFGTKNHHHSGIYSHANTQAHVRPAWSWVLASAIPWLIPSLKLLLDPNSRTKLVRKVFKKDTQNHDQASMIFILFLRYPILWPRWYEFVFKVPNTMTKLVWKFQRYPIYHDWDGMKLLNVPPIPWPRWYEFFF